MTENLSTRSARHLWGHSGHVELFEVGDGEKVYDNLGDALLAAGTLIHAKEALEDMHALYAQPFFDSLDEKWIVTVTFDMYKHEADDA